MQEEISFGVWLRKQRSALDLSRKAFANQVGCAEVTLRRIEAGTLKPSKEMAIILLEKLGIPEYERSEWVSFARGLSSLPAHSLLLLKKPKSNLPASLTSFVGRDKEQTDVIRLIAKHRLVTLTGPGGVGKTRLSIKVGEHVLENYVNGVWLVELAPVLDPTLVSRTTAIAIGLRDEPQRPVIDVLSDYLREKQLLIILDNCEHLIDACAQFIDILLKRCPGLKILTTSRETLDILGEVVYPVPSLALPDIQEGIDNFGGYESIRLFEERAQLARLDFSLTLENVPSIAEICSRLDGIPLAIELAAARINTLSPEQISKQLDESFSLLTAGSRRALPRHRTLHASMNWSWGLLTEAEQILMRRLSVFVGGWTLGSAEALSNGDILDLTNALVKKSLIVVIQESGHETRYHFHEIVRQYARERLEEADELVTMRDKHRNLFLAFVERAEPEILSAHQKEWIDAIEDEHDNIRAALSWSIESQNAEEALRFCSGLNIFWERHKHYHEATLACKDALACAKENERLKTTAWYATVLGASAFYIAFTESIPWSAPSIQASFEQARKIFEAIDHFNSTGPVLTSHILTYIYMSLNDLSSAETCVSQWYEKANAAAYQWGIALAQRTMADLSMAKGSPASALALWQESYELFMRIGDIWAATEVSRFLIWQKVIRGEFEEGVKLSKQNLLFYEEYGDPGGVAASLSNLGTIAREQGQYESARRYFTNAMALGAEIGNKEWSINGTEHIAHIDYLEGNLEAARAKYEAVLTLIKDIPIDSKYGFFYIHFAQVSLSENHFAEAHITFAVGLEILEKTNQSAEVYAAYYGLGELARLERNYPEAIENYCASLKAVYDGSRYIELPRIVDGIAETECLRSNLHRAICLFGASEALRKKMGTVIHIVDRPEYDKHIKLLKNKISATEFRSAWAEGAKMNLEEVYQYVMQKVE